jgi:hypothetical protein
MNGRDADNEWLNGRDSGDERKKSKESICGSRCKERETLDELKGALVSRRGGMRDGEWKCQVDERREVGGGGVHDGTRVVLGSGLPVQKQCSFSYMFPELLIAVLESILKPSIEDFFKKNFVFRFGN